MVSEHVWVHAGRFLLQHCEHIHWIHYGEFLHRLRTLFLLRRLGFRQFIVLPHPPLEHVSRFVPWYLSILRLLDRKLEILGPREDPYSALFTRCYEGRRDLPLSQRFHQAFRAAGFDTPAAGQDDEILATRNSIDYDAYIHFGASRAIKLMPLDVFVDLVGRLARKFKVIVSAAPPDLAALQPLRELGADFCDGDIASNAEVMRRCGVVIAHDTGMAHLAAFLHVPVISLFGPTDPRLYAPSGGVRVIRANALPPNGFDCMPCGLDRCNRTDGRFCMSEIAAVGVERLLEEMIGIRCRD